MCGQLGIIMAPRERTSRQLAHLTDVFGAVLMLSKQRGRDATGAAWVKSDGTSALYKRAVSASRFLPSAGYKRLLAGLNSHTTLLMGHTRWATVGRADDPANAQPIRAGVVIGTHNGTTTNADELFDRFQLPRHAETDSELIFRMAAQTLDTGNRIDVHALAGRLALCEGPLAAVMVATTDPEHIIMVKRDKPLEMVYNERCGLLIYASDLRYLSLVLRAHEWRRVKIPERTLVVVDSNSLTITRMVPLGPNVEAEL